LRRGQWNYRQLAAGYGAGTRALSSSTQLITNGRRPYGIAPLVEEILVGQRAEITKMRRWLREWGLASPPDATSASPG
jgi:hypothetical protein